ncbi:MAG: hypothetical protein M3171_08515 [Actinomycetota bacterium]|nr:hypothetical protein [Actinomycetota bacterium]
MAFVAQLSGTVPDDLRRNRAELAKEAFWVFGGHRVTRDRLAGALASPSATTG